MNIQHFLQTLYYAQRRVEVDAALLARMRSRLEGSGVSYDKPIVHGGITQTLGDAVINIVGLEERLEASIINRNAIAKQVLDVIDAVPDERYQLLLVLRYRDFMLWKKICRKMGYSRQGLHKLHRQALAAAEKKYAELFGSSENYEQSDLL